MNSYYKCNNCGKLFTQNSPVPLTDCPDCGDRKMKVLLPVDDAIKLDPVSGRKKVAFGGLIGLSGLATITVFLIFGNLLKGYMVYESGLDASEKARNRLAAEISEQEIRLASLTGKIAELTAKESTLLSIEEKLAGLTKKTSLAQLELDQQLERLHQSNMELASATGTVSALTMEIKALQREKGSLTDAIDSQKAEFERRSSEVQKASQVLSQKEVSCETYGTEVAEVLKNLQHQRIVLSNETAKVSGVQTKLSYLEADLDRLQKRVEIRQAEDARLAIAIESGIARTNRLASSLVDAEKVAKAATTELARVQSELDAANSALERARENNQSQSSRLTMLTERKDNLEREIRDLEKSKETLSANISELKKQHTAAVQKQAQVQASLDALVTSRDKAQTDADAQLSRLIILKEEVASLEKAKADAKK